MSIIASLLKEMEAESNTTRKMLSRIPDDKFNWQPHAKSMNIQRLAAHIAELPGWVAMILNTSELDFSKAPYTPKALNTPAEILADFEATLAQGKAGLEKATDKDLDQEWVMRNGEDIYFKGSKAEMIRGTYCQVVHHRAQLGVFLRLLDVPIPGSYGPSADEN